MLSKGADQNLFLLLADKASSPTIVTGRVANITSVESVAITMALEGPASQGDLSSFGLGAPFELVTSAPQDDASVELFPDGPSTNVSNIGEA